MINTSISIWFNDKILRLYVFIFLFMVLILSDKVPVNEEYYISIGLFTFIFTVYYYLSKSVLVYINDYLLNEYNELSVNYLKYFLILEDFFFFFVNLKNLVKVYGIYYGMMRRLMRYTYKESFMVLDNVSDIKIFYNVLLSKFLSILNLLMFRSLMRPLTYIQYAILGDNWLEIRENDTAEKLNDEFVSYMNEYLLNVYK